MLFSLLLIVFNLIGYILFPNSMRITSLHFYMCHPRCVCMYWKKWVIYKSQHNLCLFVLLRRWHVSAFASGHPQVTRYTLFCFEETIHHRHHHHKHQGLDPLIRSASRVTTALANVSSFFQLFSFLVVCSDMISKGFGLLAFFASVKASAFCIHLSCLVCLQSVVHSVRSRFFCGHKGCSLPEVSIISFLPLQFFVSVRPSESNFLTHIKM